jgi:16S rRNA (cytidine1402-2'-O)-methyltransferase
MGTLFVVSTPIGNLEDMTPRAVRVLREVALIAAEDTRHTRGLLNHFAIRTPLVSYHEHNEAARQPELLNALRDGDVALVSDAGTPAISDPGAALVTAARAAGYQVSPVPGPSAVTAAVAAAGIVSGPFISLGFLPRKAGERRNLLARIGATGLPSVLFEAPNRVSTTLADLAAAWGDRPAVVLRELTKVHEEAVAGSLAELAAQFERSAPRGEVVIVVGEAGQPATAGAADAAAVLREMARAGLSPSQAAREAAAVTGLPRSELYALARSLTDSEAGATPAGSRACGDGPGSTAESPPPARRPKGTTAPG